MTNPPFPITPGVSIGAAPIGIGQSVAFGAAGSPFGAVTSTGNLTDATVLIFPRGLYMVEYAAKVGIEVRAAGSGSTWVNLANGAWPGGIVASDGYNVRIRNITDTATVSTSYFAVDPNLV
jgi:hypothetical protein